MVIAAAAVVAGSVVAAAAAKSPPRIRLSLIPLPKSSLGSPARALSLAHDSGVISNAVAGNHTFGGAPAAKFKKLGRITGYALDYGDGASGRPGVDSVWTSVDGYRTAKDARRALRFWKLDDEQFSTLSHHGGLYVTNVKMKPEEIGTARIGNLTSYIGPNIAPVSSFDEWFAEGRYLLNVRVAAGTGDTAQTFAQNCASRLDARLKLALHCRLHGKPTRLPPLPKPGPPAGGPDLSAMALAPSDLTGQATVVDGAGYEPGPPALSDYTLFMLPAGPFDFLGQEILWYRTSNEASFRADWADAYELAVRGGQPLDLSSLGGGAQGAIWNGPSGGEAQVVFSKGRLAEIFFVQSLARSKGVVSAGDVASVAQAAVRKIDAAYSG